MIPPKLHKWRNIKQTEGLLVFAQSLCELLFDYSLDSYKVPALNLHINALELNILISQYCNGILKKGSLFFSIKELEFNIKNNLIFTKDETVKFLKYAERINNNLDNNEKLLTISNALLFEIENNYWERLKIKILDTVTNPEEKKIITKLASAFAAELQQLGFSRTYIFAKTKKFFFSTKVMPESITSCDVLSDYISIFEKEEKNYNIIFRGTFTGEGFFEELNDIAKRINIEISDSMPKSVILIPKIKKHIEASSMHNLFFTAKSIQAKDIHKAREKAELFLDFAADICRFHSHKTHLTIHDECIGHEDGKSKFFILQKPAKPMECGVIFRQAESKDKFQITLNILSGLHFTLQDIETFSKVLDFHHSAMINTDHSNQLINLWTALESFLPNSDQSKDKINSYIDNILPSLTLTYNAKILNNLLSDLNEAGKQTQDIIDAVNDGANPLEKIAFLISSSEYSQLRTELYATLKDHPLLRFRCFSINDNFKSTCSILRTISKHKQKLTYHIQRIYTLRNQIVHKANTFPYIRTLVENLHDYLDTLILSVGEIGKSSARQIDISTAIEILSTRESYYTNLLTNSKSDITRSNCLKFVLLHNIF